jgi:hypothetical protein
MGILDAAGAAQEDIMRLATAHPQLIS